MPDDPFVSLGGGLQLQPKGNPIHGLIQQRTDSATEFR